MNCYQPVNYHRLWLYCLLRLDIVVFETTVSEDYEMLARIEAFLRGCCVLEGKRCLASNEAVTEEKKSLVFLSGGVELLWAEGNGIPSVGERPQGVERRDSILGVC
ncbi:hypothetical protein TNCV_1083131 [Trichonephila clavipes]|nr:hypothetical protein TNCV_1083131 [Trichonephila clavipes]